MDRPKYEIGQRVAMFSGVCAWPGRYLRTQTKVIPETVITAGPQWRACGSRPGHAWYYRVEGNDNWTAEWCLRPIHGDEYQEPESTSIKQPEGQNA